MKTWLVTDISVAIQFPDTFMVSSNRSDFAEPHQLPAADGKRLGEALPLPADKQCSVQTDMGCQQALVFCHAPDPFGIIGYFFMDGGWYHWNPPSKTLLMSSNL